MLAPAPIPADLHPQARFWLDVADKIIKFLAVAIGAAWTWMHYLRSRTYAQKLELQLSGSTFHKDGLYIEVLLGLQNLGGSRHSLPPRSSTCQILALQPDGTEFSLRIATVFGQNRWIEPGETIHDLLHLKVDVAADRIIWVRVNLRVLGNDVEWNDSRLLKVD